RFLQGGDRRLNFITRLPALLANKFADGLGVDREGLVERRIAGDYRRRRWRVAVVVPEDEPRRRPLRGLRGAALGQPCFLLAQRLFGLFVGVLAWRQFLIARLIGIEFSLVEMHRHHAITHGFNRRTEIAVLFVTTSIAGGALPSFYSSFWRRSRRHGAGA